MSLSLRVVRASLVAAAFALPLVLASKQSITGDEVAHIAAGYSYLATREIVLNPMHPPLIKELCAVPLLFLGAKLPQDAGVIRLRGADVAYQWAFGRDFFRRNTPVERVVFWSRVPAVLLSCALAALIGYWSTNLWGPLGGAISSFLYVFDPTVTAHAQLVTTDIGFALFAALFVYSVRRFLLCPSPSRLVIAGVALGLTLGTKFSGVILVPLAAALLLLLRMNAHRREHAWISLLLMLATAYVVLWVIYLFPMDPLFYFHGVRRVGADFDARAPHFFMGELRPGSWWSYFAVAWLIKTPLPAVVAVFCAFAMFIAGMRTSWRDEALLLVPFVVLLAGYSLFAPPLGIRYVLPCYPFLFVFAGRIALARRFAPRAFTMLLAGGAIWYVVEFAVIWPDHLPYFNQIAGGYRGGTLWLDDSNVDWGQGLIALRDYLRRDSAGARPALCYFGSIDPALYAVDARSVWIDDILPRPGPGRWMLSSFCVARARLWLEERFGDGPSNWVLHTPPKAIVGHVYYVYDFDGAGAGR